MKTPRIAVFLLVSLTMVTASAWLFSAAEPTGRSASSAQGLIGDSGSSDVSARPGGRAVDVISSPIPPSSTATPTPQPEAPPAPVVEAPPEPAPEAAPAPALRAPTGEEAAIASQVLAIVNQRRAEAGCGLVQEDAQQAALAFAHSADMATRNYFDHYTPEGLSPLDRSVAVGLTTGWENIGAGMPTAESAMEAWMGSQGHRDNILMCSHTKLGVGVFQGAGDYGIYWTQLFG